MPAVPSSNDQGILIALAATLLGAWMRLTPPYLAGFPINDGGLFFVMMQAIRDNGYRLPQFVQYNGFNIPFAYPPLALYLGTGISDALGTSDLSILQWMPAVVLIMTIPAFFRLAEAVTGSRFQAGIATLFFALISRSTTWLIMGGGLTRSLGELFLILAVREIYQLFTKRTTSGLASTIILSTLVVLTHPEAALHTVGIAALFWVLLSRNRRGLLDALAVAAGVAVLSSFWWLKVLLTHGASPFLAASQTGGFSYLNLVYPVLLVFSGDPSLAISTMLALIAIAVCLFRKEWFLPAWFLLPFLLELRNAANVAVLPLSILASLTLTDLIFPALNRQGVNEPAAQGPERGLKRASLIFFVILCFYLLGGMAYSNSALIGQTVSLSDRQAFAWVKNNTPPASRFLVLTAEEDPFVDGVAEWFPALAGRSNLTTIQGMEWLHRGNFDLRMADIQSIQKCVFADNPLVCVEKSTAALTAGHEYLYVSRRPAIASPLGAGANAPHGDLLISQIEQEIARYQQIYRTSDVAIFKKLH